MPSTRRPLRTPDETRQKAPAGTVRPIQAGMSLAQRTGTNLYGQNTAPVDAYRQPPASTIIQFAPGDPVMPVPGIDDGTGAPRQYGYLVGQNILPQPRNTELISFEQLRNVSAGYEGIQLCEAAILRVLSRLELQVTPRPEYLGDDDPTAEKWKTPSLQMAEWFQEPDQRGTDLRAWLGAAQRDLMELDAVGVYQRQTRSQGLYGLELVNGATLACLVDEGGRTPLAPRPAYAQYLYGVPTGVYSADEIDYLKQTTRTDSMYGLGPVERIILRVITAIRAEAQQLRRFTDGASPFGTVEASSGSLAGMTWEQLQAWERSWNALMAGNDALRVRAKVMPPGWTFKSLEPPEVNTAFDDFLLNITISSFGLTKDELGFTDTSNRSVGESQQDVVYRNAVKPNADFFARYFANVIRRYDGQPIAKKNATVSLPGSATRAKAGVWDKRFYITWGGYEEPEDFQAKAGALANLVARGIISPEEAQRQLKIRPEQGQKPIGRFMVAPGGAASVVFLDDTVDQRDAANKARLAQLQTQEKQGDMQLQQMQLQIQAGKEQIKRQQQGDEDAESLGDGEGQDDGAQDTGDDGGGDDTGGGGGSGSGGQAGGSDDASGPQPVDLDAEDEDNNASRSIGAAEWRGISAPIDAARDATWGADGDGSGTTGDRHGHSGVTRGSSLARYSGDSRLPLSGAGGDLLSPLGAARGGNPAISASDTRNLPRTGEQPDTPDTGAGSAAEAQRAVHQEAVSAEWRRYRDKALRAVKDHRAIPPFVSDVLPADLHAHVATRLAGVQDQDAVRAIFADAQRAEQPHDHQFVEQRCLVCGCGEPTNDHGMAYPVATAIDTNPGAMVAFFVPASVGQHILLPGGEKLEDLHVTLAYLGDLADLSPAQQDALRETVAAYATRYEPLTGAIGGIGRFAAPEGEPTPVYANVDVPALPTFRQDLLAALDEAGIPVVHTHGFTPHCTLAYVPPDADFALRPTPLTPVTFAYLWVALGDARYAYPLGAKKNDDAERAQMAEALRDLKTLTAQALAQTYTGMQAGEEVRWSPDAWEQQPRGLDGKFASTGIGPKQTIPGVTHVSHHEPGASAGGTRSGPTAPFVPVLPSADAMYVLGSQKTDTTTIYAAAGKDEFNDTIEPPGRWPLVQHYIATLGDQPEFQTLLHAVAEHWNAQEVGFDIHDPSAFADPDAEEEPYPTVAHRALWAIFDAYDRVTRAGEFNPLTLAIQLAAEKEFGLEHVPDTATPEQHAAAHRMYGAAEPGMRMFLRQMYDETQAWLKDHGVTETYLFRGARFAPGNEPKGVDWNGRVEPRTITSRAVSSWATNLFTASVYAYPWGESDNAPYGLISGARVPASRIFSTEWTGFGRMGEAEVTVLGGMDVAQTLAFQLSPGQTRDNTMKYKQLLQEFGNAGQSEQQRVALPGHAIPVFSAHHMQGLAASQEMRWSPTAYLDQPRENGKFASPGPKDLPEVSLRVQAQMLGGLFAHLTSDGELTDAGKAIRAAALDHLATTLASNPAFQHLAADPYWREFDEPGISYLSDVHGVVAILRESWATSAVGLPEMDALHLAARDAFHLDGARTGFVTPAGADLYAKYGEGFRSFVQAQYDATQAYFHAHGYPAGSQITVYRGMTYPEAPPGFAPGHATRTIAMNPLSSWSAQMPTARDFATEDQYGHLIATSIPIEHVMSIAPTGLGSMAEHELILFGHTHPATVVSWDQETEPTEAELWQILAEAQHGR